MSSLKYIADVNLMTVTLGSSYTAGSGTMSLVSGHGARLPASGDFWIRTTTGIYRCFKVTARTDDTLTVVASQDGTSDGSLIAGIELKWVLGATAFDQYRSERNRIMTVAEFDALSSGECRNGDRILLSDSVYEILRAGGAWRYIYGGGLVTRPPSSDWSWDNQAGSTIDSNNGFEYMSTPKSGTVSLSVRYRSVPATPFTVKFLFKHDMSGAPPGATPASASTRYGICFRDAVGKIIEFGFGYTTATPTIQLYKWTNSTTATAAYVAFTGAAAAFVYDIILRQNAWMAISDTGTNLVFYWSVDGLHWKQLSSQSRTDFFAAGPTDFGFFAYANGNAIEVALLGMEVQASATPV